MKTNNEKWHGNSKYGSNSGAGRDGKSFEKRDVRSILKGSRGANRFSTNENENESREQKPWNNNANRSSYGEQKTPVNNEGRRVIALKKPWESDNDKPAYGERKPYQNRDNNQSGFRKPRTWEDRNDSNGERPFRKSFNSSYGEARPERPYNRDSQNRNDSPKPWQERSNSPKPWQDRNESNGERPFRKSYNSSYGDSRPERPYNRDSRPEGLERPRFRKPADAGNGDYVETRFDNNRKDGVSFRKPRKYDSNYDPNAKYSHKKQFEYKNNNVDPNKPVRLNKFLANAGICSRREADEYIQAGVISVNGEIVTEMGVKVLPTDKIMFHDQTVRSERKVYLLLNKPKDCVTTSEDTHDRLTVLDLVKNACSERIYPVGRLDRNTTGVLLLTNDGDLASKLTHPKYDKKKIYHATLDKPLEQADFETVLAGVTLDDGDTIAADALEYVKEGDLKQIGIEIHSGQNRVVRRIFEKLGYKVIRLDRVYFAGLTKKNVPRGKYRFLNPREVSMLKMGAHE